MLKALLRYLLPAAAPAEPRPTRQMSTTATTYEFKEAKIVRENGALTVAITRTRKEMRSYPIYQFDAEGYLVLDAEGNPVITGMTDPVEELVEETVPGSTLASAKNAGELIVNLNAEQGLYSIPNPE